MAVFSIWKSFLKIRFWPTEVNSLIGNPHKAKTKLGWVPEITAQELCAEMVQSDIKAAKMISLKLARINNRSTHVHGKHNVFFFTKHFNM